MPDITMCEGKDCPFKGDCYRYKAQPNEHWQSYFLEVPYMDGECDKYWPMDKDSQEGMGDE